MQRVVGLIGRKGAGKDTAAKALIAAGWRRLAYAEPLYLEVAGAFGVTVDFLSNRDTKETPLPEMALYKCRDQVFVAVCIAEAGMQLGVTSARKIRAFLRAPRSPRQNLQCWGTEYKRRIVHPLYWLNQVRDIIRANPGTNFVITDVRYPDEALLATDEFGGMLGRVDRPSLNTQTDAGMLHPTETAMRTYPVDIDLVNLDGPEGERELQQATLLAFDKSWRPGATVSSAQTAVAV
jgi:hypothetical protein